jgi:hypothetical protein
VDLWRLQRLRADRPALQEPDHPHVIRPMRTDDLPAAVVLDAEAFGAARVSLLAYLHGCQPGCAWVAESERTGGLAGFVLGRPGRATLHIGPLIARDPDIATALAARAITQERAPVSIDVPDDQREFRQRLTLAGFAPLRPFTRMLRSANPGPAGADTMFAIAGPELG